MFAEEVRGAEVINCTCLRFSHNFKSTSTWILGLRPQFLASLWTSTVEGSTQQVLCSRPGKCRQCHPASECQSPKDFWSQKMSEFSSERIVQV